jgi:hypothetical protein
MVIITAAGFWDTEGYWMVPAEAVTGFEGNVYSQAWMNSVAAMLGRTQASDRGWVFALFGGASGNGGEGVTLGLGSDVPLTQNANRMAVASDRLLPSSFNGLHFTNVELGVLHPQPFAPDGWTCALQTPDAVNVIRPNTYAVLLLNCGPR